MAGEWIKFEASTPEKREVFSITSAMGWTDPDLTVGKLLKVWRWFDQQTIAGNADGVTLPLLDSIIGVSGFAQAMCNVGWLVVTESGIALPNFERHNGKTAKDRALTAKRVAVFKANAKANDEGNGDSVTGALPKEDKRRKDSKHGAAAPGEVKDRRSKPRGSEEDYACARWLFGLILSVNQTAKPPNWDTWANDVRLLREVDGRTHHDICALFKFAKSDSFWSPNIQSPAKLREKWDVLTELKMKAAPAAAPQLKRDWQ